MEVKKIVQDIIKKCNSNDPFKIARHLGIKVIFESLGDIFGYFTNVHRIPIIHINQSCSCHKQKFICCHELGHAVSHPKHNASYVKKFTYYPNDKFESEANDFAIELLFFNSNNPITLHEMVHDYGVPEQFLLSKMKTHNKEF